MIYFIGNKQEKVVKIGYTSQSLKHRLSSIQNSNHCEMEIISICEGMKNTEGHIHNLFKELHIRGEWYTIDDKLQEFMESPTLPYIEETWIPGETMTDEDRLFIERLWCEGLSDAKIALQTRFTKGQVRNHIARHGVKEKYPDVIRKNSGNKSGKPRTPPRIVVPELKSVYFT